MCDGPWNLLAAARAHAGVTPGVDCHAGVTLAGKT